jgi:hypothetical protein
MTSKKGYSWWRPVMAKRKEQAEKEVAEKKQPAAATAPVKTATAAPPQPKPVKKGKLLPKHKSRLPRRLKKAQKKAAGLL